MTQWGIMDLSVWEAESIMRPAGTFDSPLIFPNGVNTQLTIGKYIPVDWVSLTTLHLNFRYTISTIIAGGAKNIKLKFQYRLIAVNQQWDKTPDDDGSRIETIAIANGWAALKDAQWDNQAQLTGTIPNETVGHLYIYGDPASGGAPWAGKQAPAAGMKVTLSLIRLSDPGDAPANDYPNTLYIDPASLKFERDIRL